MMNDSSFHSQHSRNFIRKKEHNYRNNNNDNEMQTKGNNTSDNKSYQNKTNSKSSFSNLVSRLRADNQAKRDEESMNTDMEMMMLMNGNANDRKHNAEEKAYYIDTNDIKHNGIFNNSNNVTDFINGTGCNYNNTFENSKDDNEYSHMTKQIQESTYNNNNGLRNFPYTAFNSNHANINISKTPNSQQYNINLINNCYKLSQEQVGCRLLQK